MALSDFSNTVSRKLLARKHVFYNKHGWRGTVFYKGDKNIGNPVLSVLERPFFIKSLSGVSLGHFNELKKNFKNALELRGPLD